MKGGRLPDGTTTNSDETYVEEWRGFAAPICEALDIVLYGFDPGLSFHTKGRYPQSIDLPAWFCRRLHAVLTNTAWSRPATEPMQEGGL